ncbi:Sulfotransferase 18 [Triticum urartu]|uniref:Sulfotransferase n=1 Tax=Triticum urartu TaxID=4572 RepID=M8A476_TRIUA|nr:Sulfotransferase 18 [Triticum urartu]
MRSVEANRTGEYGVHWKFSNSAFFRNGEVGDWKQHITAEMAQRIDGIMDGSPIVVVFCNLLKNPQKHLVK